MGHPLEMIIETIPPRKASAPAAVNEIATLRNKPWRS
jgi:hypothetical protein